MQTGVPHLLPMALEPHLRQILQITTTAYSNPVDVSTFAEILNPEAGEEKQLCVFPHLTVRRTQAILVDSKYRLLASRSTYVFLSFLLFFLSDFLLILCGFHIMLPNPTLYLVSSFPPSAIANAPPEKNNRNFLSWKLSCVTVRNTVYPLVRTASLANVHCNESLVLVEVSGFCYTINTGSSLQLLWDILLLPCVVEILLP